MDRAEIERLIAAVNEFGDSHLIRAKDGTSYGTWAFRKALTQLLADRNASRAEVSAMRPVVDAASAWRTHRHNTFTRERHANALEQALEAYRANKAGR